MMVAALGPQAIAVDVTASVTSVGGVPLHVVEPSSTSIVDGTPIYLEIHGGGLLFGGGEACRVMSVLAAERSGWATGSADYRMPPDHPYPAALDDCFAVYRRLLASATPGDVVVGGGSAGGNLAAAVLLRARAEGLPMPAALVLITPEVDLTESGDSFETNLGVDTVLTEPLDRPITLYADGHDLDHPSSRRCSATCRSGAFPPTFLQTGTRDLFLSNTVRMHRALRQPASRPSSTCSRRCRTAASSGAHLKITRWRSSCVGSSTATWDEGGAPRRSTLTGTRLNPATFDICTRSRRSSSTVKLLGRRSADRLKTTGSSTRASAAPRQLCTPSPKPSTWLGDRSMSKVSGES